MTRIAVIGDVLLDGDLDGRAERLCPDSAAPVVDVERVVERPGGAALAAVLARRHDVDVTLIAPFADDAPAQRLRRLLADLGVDVVALRDAGATGEKLRVRVDGRSLVRIDRGVSEVVDAVPAEATDVVADVAAVLVADYGRGCTPTDGLRHLVRTAMSRSVPVVWDPHPRGAPPLAGVTLATPNRREVLQAVQSNEPMTAVAPLLTAAEELRRRWGCEALAVTLGSEGAGLVGSGGLAQVTPAVPIDGADACGAGDAFAAAATVAAALGADPPAAVPIAVAAAGRFVAEGGAAGLLTEAPVTSGRTSRSPDAHRDLDSVRGRGGTIVATGGCFDVLHPGHVSTLERARELGDFLVVLVNSDRSVRRLKGPGRPVQRVEDRMRVLRSLSCVDLVVPFEEDNPVIALEQFRPDVFVKGGDYAAMSIPEAAVMSRWAGVVVTMPFVNGHSTTGILGRAARSSWTPSRPLVTTGHVS